MNLAYFSPLGPQRSGISDYSEELLPHLAEEANITLFVDGFQPTNRELTSRFEVRDYRRHRAILRELDAFDAVVYHMGNDHRYHTGILEATQKRAGVVVFHDFALQEFFLGFAREHADLRLYLDEVAFCHGEDARKEAAESLSRGATPSILARPVAFPLNCRIANAAEGIIVHSNWSSSRFSRIAPSVPLVTIPMPVELPAISLDHSSPINKGRPGNEIKIASFGLITPGKGIEQSLRVLSALKSTHRFRYFLIGETNPYFDVRELVRRYRMEDRVEITGHVTLEDFKRHIKETDIALNLRERTVGETSASLCRLMAAGVCSLVAEEGWYAELPDDSVVKIPLDSASDGLLHAYLKRLLEDEPLRKRIGGNARRYAFAEHSVEQRAADYLSFIREVIDRRLRRRLIVNVSHELSVLGVKPSDNGVLSGVAEEVRNLTSNDGSRVRSTQTTAGSNASSANGKDTPNAFLSSVGRTPKPEAINYKQAAIEYLGKLSEERQHHLRTKPFYNLANKPVKYRSAGMDEDMHRHFCDFANMAVSLALPAGSRILDVGCGSGWLSEYFARLGYEVMGIDISPALIEMSRERVDRVPYGADHETPLRCTFRVHDVELVPLAEKFDAVICYDSLHHFNDESSVIRNIATMLPAGGVIFILEGERPPRGSASEEELLKVMHEFGTLESPFDFGYLRGLLEENGLAIIGDYVSINGLFAREDIEDDLLKLKPASLNYHYVACKKVADGVHASTIPDSRQPGFLRARITSQQHGPLHFAPGEDLELELEIQNIGDTLWLSGQETRPGIVMPAVRIMDEAGTLVSEFHGDPPLPHPIAPEETIKLRIVCDVPRREGRYTIKIDLVDQQICWFEQQGSEPLTLPFEVGKQLQIDHKQDLPD